MKGRHPGVGPLLSGITLGRPFPNSVTLAPRGGRSKDFAKSTGKMDPRIREDDEKMHRLFMIIHAETKSTLGAVLLIA